jgi:hypothetical protein
MSDKDIFISLLTKIPDCQWNESVKGIDPEFGDCCEIADTKCAIRISVLPGYRCHFEAEFDAAGNVLNMGQWDDL